MSESNYTPGGSPNKSGGAASGPGEIKYVSIGRINDAHLLLTVPSSSTKKAYADEVSDRENREKALLYLQFAILNLRELLFV